MKIFLSEAEGPIEISPRLVRAIYETCLPGGKASYNFGMALTALELSPEELKKYHPLEAIRKRRAKNREAIAKRRRRAYAAALKAAKLLKEQFGAKEVILFGSLARRGSFSLYSDIDLAARGIAPLKFYAASAAIERVDLEFQIDLVELESCSPTLLDNIAKDGKVL